MTKKELLDDPRFSLCVQANGTEGLEKKECGSVIIKLYYSQPLCRATDQDCAVHIIYSMPEESKGISTLELIYLKATDMVPFGVGVERCLKMILNQLMIGVHLLKNK